MGVKFSQATVARRKAQISSVHCISYFLTNTENSIALVLKCSKIESFFIRGCKLFSFGLKEDHVANLNYDQKLNLLLFSLWYAEACNGVGGAHFRGSAPAGNTAHNENMLQRWRDVGNNMYDLTVSKVEPQTSRSRDKPVTARPTKDQYF